MRWKTVYRYFPSPKILSLELLDGAQVGLLARRIEKPLNDEIPDHSGLFLSVVIFVLLLQYLWFPPGIPGREPVLVLIPFRKWIYFSVILAQAASAP